MLISMTLLNRFRGRGLCSEGLDKAYKLLGDEPLPAHEAVDRHLANGGTYKDIFQAYTRMVQAGILPNTGLHWRIARLAFLWQPEKNAHLRKWANELGPENWMEARTNAYNTYTTDAATYVATYAIDAVDAADVATYNVVYAADIAAVAYAAVRVTTHEKAWKEILRMVVEEVEKV